MRHLLLKSGILLLLLLSFIIFLFGCATTSAPPAITNNHLTIPDMVRYFEKRKVPIQTVALLNRDVINCDDALSIKISGSEIGIYKFNDHIKKQHDRWVKIVQNGYVYLCGIKKRTVVNGAFVMIDSDINPKRELIEKVFMDFTDKPSE